MTASEIAIKFCLLVIASGIALAACDGSGTQGSDKPELADFDFLELGMSYDEIVSRVGEADRDIGSGVHLMVYELADGTEIVLSFPSLASLAAVHSYDPETDERELILGS
jgi:hypothetical protein